MHGATEDASWFLLNAPNNWCFLVFIKCTKQLMLLGFIKSTKQLTTDHPPTLYKLKKLQRRNQVKVLLKESLILGTGTKHCYHVALVITLSLLLFNWNSILFTSYFLHSVILFYFILFFYFFSSSKLENKTALFSEVFVV